MREKKPFWLILCGVLCWQLLYLGLTPYDLAPDEAYYWTWSKRLQWGYFSKPPMVALIIRATTSLGGDSPFFLRLGAPLLWALTEIALFFLALDLFGPRTALWTFLLSVGTLSTPVVGLFMTIDPPLLFFWTLSMLLYFKALRGRKAYWYLGGFSFGLGLLSKYTMGVLGVSLLLFLLLDRPNRAWLRRKEPYLSALIALGVFLPHLLWEYRHGLIAFRHTADLLDKGGGFRPWYFLEFLGGQALLVTPVTFLLFLWGLAKGVRETLKGDGRYGFCTFTAAVLFGICLGISLKGPCYANWGAPAYVSGLILGARALEDSPWPERRKRRALGISLGVGLLFIGLAYSLEAFRTLPWVPQEDFPTSRVMGWRELGEEVARLRRGLSDPFVLTPDRRIAAEVAFYGGDWQRVYQYNRSEVPGSQFHLWGGLEREAGRDAIVVIKGKSSPPKDLVEAFQGCQPLKDLDIVRKGRPIKAFSLYLCRGFKGIR